MEERLKAEISKTNEKLDDVNQNLSIKINDVQQDLNEFKIKTESNFMSIGNILHKITDTVGNSLEQNAREIEIVKKTIGM